MCVCVWHSSSKLYLKGTDPASALLLCTSTPSQNHPPPASAGTRAGSVPSDSCQREEARPALQTTPSLAGACSAHRRVLQEAGGRTAGPPREKTGVWGGVEAQLWGHAAGWRPSSSFTAFTTGGWGGPREDGRTQPPHLVCRARTMAPSCAAVGCRPRGREWWWEPHGGLCCTRGAPVSGVRSRAAFLPSGRGGGVCLLPLATWVLAPDGWSPGKLGPAFSSRSLRLAVWP